MLTPEQWNQIGKQAEYLYAQLELEIIEEIAVRIANVGYANTVVLNDVLIAQEMGLMYQDVITLVAKYNKVTEKEIQQIFEEAGATSLSFDDKIYKEAGLNPVPIKRSRSMMQLMSATIEKTQYNLNNLVMTTASTSQTQFYNAMNKAYMEVSTGIKSYSQSIIDTIKEVSKQGAYIEYPSGKHRSIESAVRTNIVTSVNQTCGKLQELRANDMGCDLMEITAHSGARPEHAEWQGKIVSRSGNNKKYLSLKDIGYGEVDGFKGVNCRHDWMPFYEGSTRTYTNKELKKLESETVRYNGKTINKYEATQIQRKMERQIRQDKKEIAGLQGILTSNNADINLEQVQNKFRLTSNQLKQKELILNDFLNQTELKRDRTREVVNGVDKSLSQKIIQASKKIDKNKEILYNSNVPLGKKLGFIDNNNVQTFIPKETEITNIVEIAGKNSKEFRNAKKYVEIYGGKNSEWSKKAGKIESDKYIFDIHWVQGENGILTEWKIKNKKLKGGI